MTIKDSVYELSRRIDGLQDVDHDMQRLLIAVLAELKTGYLESISHRLEEVEAAISRWEAEE